MGNMGGILVIGLVLSLGSVASATQGREKDV